MNRCSFIISQRAQDFSQDEMGPQCSLGPIVGWLYTRIDDKCEAVVKPIIDFADEFSDFLDRVPFRELVAERLSRQFPKSLSDFWRRIRFQSVGQ